MAGVTSRVPHPCGPPCFRAAEDRSDVSRLSEPWSSPGSSDVRPSRSDVRRIGRTPTRVLPRAAGHAPVEPTADPVPRPARGRLPRVGEAVLATLSLVAVAPLLLIIACAVKLTTRGPVLYVQPRVGLDRRNGGRPQVGDRRRSNLGGRPFDIYKFRTMYHRSGPRLRQVWTRPNDRRITPVGRFLRAYRLDELPQLVNVLRGEMSLVGPRPEQPEIFAQLRERHDRYPERQRVPPGITGLAQVRCGYGGTPAELDRKLACDLEYVENVSAWLDLRILLLTIPVVLTRRGAR